MWDLQEGDRRAARLRGDGVQGEDLREMGRRSEGGRGFELLDIIRKWILADGTEAGRLRKGKAWLDACGAGKCGRMLVERENAAGCSWSGKMRLEPVEWESAAGCLRSGKIRS